MNSDTALTPMCVRKSRTFDGREPKNSTIIINANTRFSSSELKARRSVPTYTLKSNRVYKHTTKTTVYKTYTWCKGRESPLGN